jgi:Na+/H+ antiporter NhaD/arsenite permease-like protein
LENYRPSGEDALIDNIQLEYTRFSSGVTSFADENGKTPMPYNAIDVSTRRHQDGVINKECWRVNLATAIFALTYVLISLGENSPRKLDRPTVALLGAVLMVMTGSLTRAEAAAALDFSTLAVLFGMMVLLTVMMQSRLPTWLALRALSRCHNPHALLALVVFSSGLASAVMLNDTVCLLGSPLLLEITEQARITAVPFLLALATSSNIGSAMTLTGNPQNIIIGHASGLGWSAFALRMAPIVALCLTVNWLMLEALYRKSLASVDGPWDERRRHSAPHTVPVDHALAFKSVCVFAGLILAFLAGAPMDFASVTAATALLVWANRAPREALGSVDWSLLLFFAGLFVVVAGFVKADRYLLEQWTGALRTQKGLASVVQFSLVTLVGSNLFSNVPFVLIISHWVKLAPHPQFIWMLLALTSTFAGNLTLFGSVANVIVAQGAQPQVSLRFSEFLRVGAPITLVTTSLGALLLWVFWKLGWLG